MLIETPLRHWFGHRSSVETAGEEILRRQRWLKDAGAGAGNLSAGMLSHSGRERASLVFDDGQAPGGKRVQEG